MGATLPRFPALLAAAEQQAREVHKAIFGREPEGERLAAWTEAHATLLADLTRPTSRDHWARFLAERCGLTVGATAPGWECVDLNNGGRRRLSSVWWVLTTPGQAFNFGDDPPSHDDGQRLVPGISALTDPAEALAAACLAVGGAA